MLNGPQAYRALDEALKDIRREEDDITRRLSRAAERVAKLKESELALVRDLARLRLDAGEGEALEGALREAEARARTLLGDHARDVAKREEALDALEARLVAQSAERAQALEALAELQTKFAGFEAAAEAKLDGDAVHRETLARRDALAATIEKARGKAETAARDAADKGRPYEDDPLFSYLLERGYGGPDYAAAPLIRALDGQVARLVRFERARADYFALKAIPARLTHHLERLVAQRAAADAELEAMGMAAIEGEGGGATGRQIAEAERAIAEIDGDVLAVEDERDRLTQEHKALAEGRDSHFEDAVKLISDALARSDTATLLAQARATRTSADDALVAKIEQARLGITEVEAEMRDQRARLSTLEARRRELEDISYEFKTQRYDDPRSQFGNDRLVGDLLNDFLRGAITASSYWGQWRQSQDWTGSSGPIMPPGPGSMRGSASGGGFNLPPGGFSPRPPGGWGRPPRAGGAGGGGFSRPRTGSRGARTGGGFKTGGGF